jgi:hypothetical protein
MATCSGVRIFWENYIDLDYLASADVSSEQAAFPATNAYNAQRRSKVWRSNGYFNVTSSNNTIIFRETNGGSDLTATIAVAEYTSLTAMCAAIKTALEAVGDSTYTVTNTLADGYKFKIVSNGAGGTADFDLMLTNAGFTAASILGFATTTDLTSATLTRTADYLRINTSEWIEWDLGIATNPSSFALIGPRNEPLKFSPSATIKLQANHTDTWTTPPWETTLTYHDFSLFKTSDAGLADDDYRFWRVLIEDQNPNGYVEVGAFMLGEFFNPVRGRVQFPLDISQEDRTTVVFSEGGQSYSDIKPKTASYSIKWFGLQKADIEYIEDQWARYGKGVPFFASVDSTETFTTDAERRVIFCSFVNEPSFTLERPDVWSCTFILKEAL